MIEVLGRYNLWVAIFLMMTGLFVVIDQRHLIKKLIGLAIFQTSAFILYISMGKLAGGRAPIYDATVTSYSNPLPQVLILTAIVVGVATSAVGIALVLRIHAAYGSVDENRIQALDAKDAT